MKTSNLKFWLIWLVFCIITLIFCCRYEEILKETKPVKLITMMEVQQNLVKLGYLDPNDCDGIVGPKTIKQWSYAELHETEKRRMKKVNK